MKNNDGLKSLMGLLVPGKILPDDENVAHIAQLSGCSPEMIWDVLFGNTPKKLEGIGFGAPPLG